MVDYWSVVVDCLRSKVKGLNPLQIYNMKQALSSILTIIFYIFFAKTRIVHRFTDSRVHRGVGVIGALRLIGVIGALRLIGLIGSMRRGYHSPIFPIVPILPILPIVPITLPPQTFRPPPLHFPKILLSLSAIIYVRANN